MLTMTILILLAFAAAFIAILIGTDNTEPEPPVVEPPPELDVITPDTPLPQPELDMITPDIAVIDAVVDAVTPESPDVNQN